MSRYYCLHFSLIFFTMLFSFLVFFSQYWNIYIYNLQPLESFSRRKKRLFWRFAASPSQVFADYKGENKVCLSTHMTHTHTQKCPNSGSVTHCIWSGLKRCPGRGCRKTLSSAVLHSGKIFVFHPSFIWHLASEAVPGLDSEAAHAELHLEETGLSLLAREEEKSCMECDLSIWNWAFLLESLHFQALPSLEKRAQAFRREIWSDPIDFPGSTRVWPAEGMAPFLQIFQAGHFPKHLGSPSDPTSLHWLRVTMALSDLAASGNQELKVENEFFLSLDSPKSTREGKSLSAWAGLQLGCITIVYSVYISVHFL